MASTSSSTREGTPESLRRVRSTGDIERYAAYRLTPGPERRQDGPYPFSIESVTQSPSDDVGESSAMAERAFHDLTRPDGRDTLIRPAPRPHCHRAHYHRYSEGHYAFSTGRPLDRPFSDLTELEPALLARTRVRDSGLSIRHSPVPSPSRIPISSHRERTIVRWTDPATPFMLGEPEPRPDPYIPPSTPPAEMVEPMPPNLPRYRRIMTFLGYGRYATKARKALVSLVWTLSFSFVQIVIVVTLLVYSSRVKSPAMPQYNEWEACDRPLGVWNALWVGKILMGCSMAVWGFGRDRVARLNAAIERQNVLAMAETGRLSGRQQISLGREAAHGAGAATRTTDNAATTGRQSHGSNPDEASNRPHAQLFSRMSFLSSLLTLTWFVIAHILEYTSVKTCRHDAPHLWWLTFGILCIMYLTVVEVIIVGLVVFVFGPLIFLFWNIILILLGRHPIQNPGYIKPEIGKLPRSVVEHIPLVLYIPPPPDDVKSSPVTYPPPIYTYPPKSPISSTLETAASGRRRKRFAFLRKITKKGLGSTRKHAEGKGMSGDKGGEKDGDELTWEENWEQGDYPFVRLEDNRAACAICLLDFEEPKRVRGLPAGGNKSKINANTEGDHGVDDQPTADGHVEELRVDEVTEEERAEILRLEDAGEGPQPLRLLGCGHVFHKTCLDPWLIDVSGRCPVCQRAVELPVSNTPKKSGRRTNRRS